MNQQPKRGRGQPRKEATAQIRIYSADKPKLKGKTQAEAVRRLLGESLRPPSVTVTQMDDEKIEGYSFPPEGGVAVCGEGSSKCLRAAVRVKLKSMPIGPCLAVFSGMPVFSGAGFDDVLNGVWIVEKLTPNMSLNGPAFVYDAEIRKVPTMEMFLAWEREEKRAKRAKKPTK